MFQRDSADVHWYLKGVQCEHWNVATITAECREKNPLKIKPKERPELLFSCKQQLLQECTKAPQDANTAKLTFFLPDHICFHTIIPHTACFPHTLSLSLCFSLSFSQIHKHSQSNHPSFPSCFYKCPWKLSSKGSLAVAGRGGDVDQ